MHCAMKVPALFSIEKTSATDLPDPVCREAVAPVVVLHFLPITNHALSKAVTVTEAAGEAPSISTFVMSFAPANLKISEAVFETVEHAVAPAVVHDMSVVGTVPLLFVVFSWNALR